MGGTLAAWQRKSSLSAEPCPTVDPQEDAPVMGLRSEARLPVPVWSLGARRDAALRLFHEAKTWGDCRVEFGDASHSGSFYVHLRVTPRDTVTVRVSDHEATAWRKGPNQIDLAEFASEGECLLEARGRVERLLAGRSGHK